LIGLAIGLRDLLSYSNRAYIFYWTKQAQSIQWKLGLITPFVRCHFPINTKYSASILC